MMDDELPPWGTLQCAGKLAGHRLLDWSFYALILVFPVIWYFIFGSWFKSQLGSLVSAGKGLYLDIFWIWKNCHNKKKRCSHYERCARAKAKDRVRRWRRQALPVALVVCCWRRSSIPGSPLQFFWNLNNLSRLFKNKAPCLAFNISQTVHLKWKKKKVGLSSLMSELKLSTLQGFCEVDHDFLRLPQLLKLFAIMITM
jgi:hypothetical protein